MGYPVNVKSKENAYYLNAYAIAVKHGFVGTEEEWLASLNGMSAYEYAVKGGYTGTEEEFMELMGDASTAVTQAEGYASAASSSADDASGYATAAASSATSAANSADDASDYASAASGYATNAQNSETAASGYKDSASDYADAASGYATTASGAATDASGYATNAASSASDAATSATNASASETNAANSATAAGISATGASTNALKAEGFAVGQQNGSDVTSDSPYYHNNAEYYKEEAATSATSAGTDALIAEGYAVGKQNGEDVASGSPYYENNAKYYSEEASISASSASDSADAAADSAADAQASAESADFINFLPTDSAIGAIATFPDGANNIPVKDLAIAINPVQSGSGDPAPDNIRPISGWTGANVSHTGGTNMVASSDFVQGTISATGEDSTSTFRLRSPFVEITANGSYYYTTNDENLYVYEIYYYDSAYSYLSRITGINSTSRVETAPNNAKYVKILLRNSDNSTIVASDLTQFEMLVYELIPISWQTEAGTVYGGTLDVTTGVLTVNKVSFTLTGSNAWSNFFAADNGTVSAVVYTSAAFDNMTPKMYADGSRQIANAISDNGVLKNDYWAGNRQNAEPGWFAFTSGGSWCRVMIDGKNGTITDTTAFAANFGTKQICYELATPVTYQLTPVQVATLLGTNNVWHDANGNTTVEYRADIAKYIDKKLAE